jgi:hypothetical protein
MPLTALGGSTGTVVIGDTTTAVFPQTFHPNVASFLAQLSANSFNATRAQADALNNLVWSMVGLGIWSKMKIVYPFLGGTAATHKFNLVNPQDTDAAFRLVFTGGWTHSSTGAKGNGSTAWADTFLIPNTSLTTTSGHLSYYSRLQSQETTNLEWGCQNSGGSNIVSFAIARATTNISSWRFGTNAAGATPTFSGTSSQGLYLGNQNGSGINDRNMYRNGVKGSAQTATGTPSMPTVKLYLNALNNNGTAANWSPKECAFASVGDGLTDLEIRNYYTLVQAYQTALGRNVT